MATYYSDMTNATNTNQNAHQRDDARSVTSGLYIATAKYVNSTTITEATGDIIQLVKLPAGAVVIPSLSNVVHGDMATTTWTCTVGDVGDPDRYAVSVACASDVGQKFFVTGTTALPVAAITPYVIVEPASGANDTRLVTATLTITTPTDSAVISFNIVYRLLN